MLYKFLILKCRRGVSLIEMLVVIGIIGILTAVTVPVLSNYSPGIQLSGSARTLTSDLREAQEKAVTEQDQHLIRFVQLKNPPIYRMIKIKKDPETQIPIEEQISEEQLSTNITLSLDPDISEIIFSPDGGPSTMLKVTLAIDGNQKKIDISHAGFIKIDQ